MFKLPLVKAKDWAGEAAGIAEAGEAAEAEEAADGAEGIFRLPLVNPKFWVGEAGEAAEAEEAVDGADGMFRLPLVKANDWGEAEAGEAQAGEGSLMDVRSWHHSRGTISKGSPRESSHGRQAMTCRSWFLGKGVLLKCMRCGIVPREVSGGR